MDPLPAALLRRELGWSTHNRPFDYTKVLTTFHASQEDNVTIMRTFEPEQDLFALRADEQDPVYNMDHCTGNNANIVAVGFESGLVTLIDTAADVKNKIRFVHGCHDRAVFSLSWSHLKPHQLVTGSGDQNVRVWDCKSNFQMVRQFKGHSRTVKKVAFHPSQSDVVVSASRDGAIRIWDLRSHNELAENYITYAHSQLPNKRLKVTIDTEVPVTDLLFQDDNTLISCGSHDGFIKFWDLRKTYKQLKKKEPVRTIRYPLKDRGCVGFSSMCLDNMNNLYAASASKEIFKFNLSSESENPSFVFENAEKMTFDIKMSLSSCGRYLASGSRTPFAHIWDTWNTTSSLPFTYLDTEASVVSFSPEDTLKIVTGGDDGRVVIWRAGDVNRLYQRKNTIVDRDMAPKSEVMPPRYLQEVDKYPRYPKYKKLSPATATANTTASAFDLSSLLSDLPNAVIDGNYSNTRQIPRTSRSTCTPKRRSSILTLIQSSPTSTSSASSTTSHQMKRSSPVSSKQGTPKPKRRKSVNSISSPSSMQPKIVSFLQPFSQSAV